MPIRRPFRRLFRLPGRAPADIEREVAEEIAFHIEMRAGELIMRGVSPRDARERAEREFGDVGTARAALLAEDVRLERRARWRARVDGWHMDLRFAVRALRTRPGFTAAAVLTLALGIGANTAVYGMVRAVVLRPLPYTEPDRLVALWEADPQRGLERGMVSSGNYMDWLDRSRSFAALGAYSGPFGLALTGGTAPEHVIGRAVAPSVFGILGVPAALGRVIGAADGEAASPDVVLISHGLWQRRFGGSPDVIGQTLWVNEAAHRIIGVMPATFRFPTVTTDVWLPRPFSERDRQTRDAHQWLVIGRLDDGVSIEETRGEMARVAAAIREDHPAHMEGRSVTVLPYRHDLVGDARPALLALLAAAGLLMLIACANVANLLVARGMARRTETAVRSALGAGRGRLVRQLLVETALLAGLGAVLGVLTAILLTKVFVAAGPADLPLLEETRIDRGVLSFAAAVLLGTIALVGLVPALRLSEGALRHGLARAGSRGGAAGDRRTREALLVAQVAVSVTLLIGAGLLIRSFVELNRVDYGFDAGRLGAAGIDLGSSRYRQDERQVAFVDGLRARVAALPGVAAVGGSSDPPVVGYQFSFDFAVEGRPGTGASPMEAEGAYLQAVTPGFFRAVGVPLLRGRGIEEDDRASGRRVAVIGRALERRTFADGDAIGRRIRFSGSDEDAWFEIVGVVGDTRHYGLEVEQPAVVYIPFAQKPWSWLTTMTLLVRTEGEPAGILPAVREEVRALDPNLPLQVAAPVMTLYAESVARQRFVLALIGAFAAIAMLLGAIGLYGVAAYTVTQRRREIGLRIALGARPEDTTRMVLRQGLVLTLAGILVGSAGALALGGLLGDLLYQIDARDPLTYGAVAALLIAVAAVAFWLPGRRASRTRPMMALRSE